MRTPPCDHATAVLAAAVLLALDVLRWGVPPPPRRPAGTTLRATRLTVRICGEVRRPGTYSLEAPALVLQAVRAASGPTRRADLTRLNLSRALVPDTTLRVPSYDLGFVPVLDVNRSPDWELCRIPGVGPTLARRIVAARETHGRFRTWKDLLAVSGIGPVTLERIRKRACLGGEAP